MSGENTNNTYTNVSDLPTMSEITSPAYVPVEDANKDGKKVDLSTVIPGTLKTTNYTAQDTNASEPLTGTVNLHRVAKTGSYNDLLNKPTVARLKTDNSTASATSSGESISGTINLHKVSKTGTYSDLINKPVLNTYNWEDLNINKTEEINGTINLHAIAKTGSWSSLRNKPYGYDLASWNDDPSFTPGSTIDWNEGEPLRIQWSTITNGANPSTYGDEKHQVLDTCMILNFDDTHLLYRGEYYPADFGGSTEIVIYIDPSFDFTYTDRANNEYTGIASIVDLYARIVGRDDTRYDTTHPLSVVIGKWNTAGDNWEFEIERTLTCLNPTSTLDVTKDGYIRITGLMTYEIVQV